ncbi:MAG: monovalent cation/H(+) antiporter subunit G [Hyphomicrobiales bacterium]|nr:monovalent cation/H(+) antiporter subunit G [Hyphomicrobiales bacterium]
MIDLIRDIVTGLALAFGGLFYVVGAIGLVRMPDMFTRLHAASVMETVGASLLVIGMMVAAGLSLVTAKLAIILAILLLSGPVAAHALANAALTTGLAPLLAEDRTGKQGKKRAGKGGKPSKR